MKILPTNNPEFPWELRLTAQETGEDEKVVLHKTLAEAEAMGKEVAAFLLIRKPIPRKPTRRGH